MASVKEVAKIRATIDLVVDDKDVSEADKKIKQLDQDAKSLGKTGNKIKYQVDLDEKGLAKVNSLKNEFKDGVNVRINDEYFKKQLVGLTTETKSELQKLKALFEEVYSGAGNKDIGTNMVSDISSAKAQVEELNSTIQKKQSLLDETQAKIEQYANSEIDAIKRVQKAHEEYQNKENKSNAKKFAAEYENYLDKYDDPSKLGYTSSSGKKKTGDSMFADFDDALDEYNITFEELDKVKQKILKQTKEIGSYSDSDLSNFKSTISSLKSELTQLTKERDSLIKAINSYSEETATDKSKVKSKTEDIDKTVDKSTDKSTTIQDDGNVKEILTKIKIINEDTVLDNLKNKEIEVTVQPKVSDDFVLNIPNARVRDIVNKEELFKDIGFETLQDKVGYISVDVDFNIDQENISTLKRNLTSSINPVKLELDIDKGNNVISEINKSVTELNSSLQTMGVKSVKEITQASGDLVKIKKEQEALTKQKTEFEKVKAKFEQSQIKTSETLSQKDILGIQSDLIDAGNKTKGLEIDTNSIKIGKDGVVSFKAVIQELDDVITVATYKIDNFDKAITATGRLSSKALNESFVSSSNISKKISDDMNYNKEDNIEEQFNKALSKTKDFKINSNSFRIDDTGIITFTQSIDEADGKVTTLRYKIDDLNNSLTKSGSLSKNKLKESIISDSELKEIDSIKKELLNTINQRRTLDSRDTANVEGSDVSNRRDDLLKLETSLEEELWQKAERRKMTLQEIVNLENQITKAKNEELKVYSLSEKQLYDQNKKVAKSLNEIDSSNLINQKIEVVNNEDVSRTLKLSEYVDELTTSVKQYQSALESGNYTSRQEVVEMTTAMNQQLDTLQRLNVEENKRVGKKSTYQGSFITNRTLSELSALEKVQAIQKELSKNNQKVKIGSWSDINNSVGVELINGDKIQKTTAYLDTYTDVAGKTAVAVRTLNTAEKEYQTSGQKWISGFENKLRSLTQYITGLELVMRAWNEIKKGFTFVKEFDSSLTTINQTMSATSEELKNLGESSIDLGKNLGADAQNVLSAAAIYANASETAQSVLEKAEPTILLANASGVDSKTAADQIQGVVQQFDELEGQERRIVNSYEKISAGLAIDFATGINRMSDGVQTAGSVAAEAGLQFETFAAMVGKTSEVTRQEGSQIGNAMKTIMARISRSKSADEDVTDADRSNASKAYGAIGISLYNNEGEYQDLNVTLDALAEKWGTLTDAERNYIAEQSAGIRNINTFNAMMKTYADSKELASTAMGDTDFIDETQEKYMESMQAKINELTATVQDFWNSFLDTGAINVGIDLFSGLMNILTGLVNLFETIGNILPGVNGSFTTFAGTIATVATAYSALSHVKGRNEGESILSALGKTGEGARGVGSKALSKTSDFFGIFKDGFSKGYNREMAQSNETSSAFFRGISSGSKGAISSLSTMSKTILGIGAALVAIDVGIKIFDHFTDSTKEIKEEVEKLNSTYKENQETLKSNRATIDEIGYEYEKLSSGVDSFGNNVSLTSTEFEKYKDICNQIASMYPNLVKSYDAQGNAILNLKGNVQELNDVYDEAVLKAARDATSGTMDYQKAFNSATDKRSWGDELWDTLSDWGTADIGGRTTAKEVSNELKKIQKMDFDEIQRYMAEQTAQRSDELSWLMDSDNFGLSSGMDENEWAEKVKQIPAVLDRVNGEVNNAAIDLKTNMQEWLKVYTLDETAYPEFANLDNEVIDRVSSLIANTSSEQLEKLEDQGVEAQTYVRSLIEDISGNEKAQLNLDNLLSINDDTSLEDRKKIIEDNLDELAKVLQYDDKAELKIKLGLEDDEKLISEVDRIVETVNKETTKKAEDALNALNEQSSKSNTNLLDRVKAEDKLSGVPFDSGEFAQVYSNDEMSVVVTPVLPNGEVMSQEDLNKYIEETVLKGGLDTKGVTLSVFDKDNVKDAKNIRKEADKYAKSTNKAKKYYEDLEDSTSDVRKFIKENNITTQEQLDTLFDCVMATEDWAEAASKFSLENVTMGNIDEIIKNLDANLKVVEEDIQNINDAFSSSHTSIGLSADEIDNVVKAFSGLDGYDYDKLFESTAEGVHLNVQELERLNGEYDKTNKSKYTDTISKMRDEYAKLCIQIDNASDSTTRIQKIEERNNLANQIKDVQELQSRYEGLTNAVTKWQEAKSGGEEGDTYNAIANDIESIQELYNQGLVGTNEFKSAVQMMTNEDLSGQGTGAYVETYKQKIDQFKSFFTETSEGAENFLNTLHNIDAEMANQNADGSWNINADIEEVAKQLGMSESAITEIFKRLNDYGFDVDFREETDNLKNLRKEAEAANEQFSQFGSLEKLQNKTKDEWISLGISDSDIDKLNELKDFKFDLEVENEDALRKQIDDAKVLRKALVATYGDGSDEVKAFDKQLNYLKASAGQTMDSLNFKINYNDNKDEIDDIISKLKSLEEYSDLEFDFNTTSIDNVDNQLKSLEDKLEDLAKDENGVIDLSAPNATELIDLFHALNSRKLELERPAVMNLDANDFKDEYQTVMTDIQNYQIAIENLKNIEADVNMKIRPESDLEAAKSEVNKAKQAMQYEADSSESKIMANLGIDVTKAEDEINNSLSAINVEKLISANFSLTDEAKVAMGEAVSDKDSKVVLSVDDAQVKAWKAPSKSGVASYSASQSDQLKNWTPPVKYGTIKYTGKSKLNGTAHVNGTAYVSGTTGNFGAKKDEVALVGEVDPELRVNSRTGQWELLGENGAEFANINKNDIIFNSVQTKELFENGYVTSNGGRGKAYLRGTVDKIKAFFKGGSGTAYASGTYTTSGSLPGANKFYNNYQWNTNTGQNTKKETNDFLETFDWVEVLIDRIERKIQQLDTVASSVYRNFSKRNTALADEFSEVAKEINIQQQAYNTYLSRANSVNLSEYYKSKVRNGELSIEDITDENLSKQIQDYQEWYEKALDCEDAVIDLKETLGELAKTKFDNVIEEFDNMLNKIQDGLDVLDTELEIIEAKGNFAGSEYFKAMMNTEQDNLDTLLNEYKALQDTFANVMATGEIDEGSTAWHEMQQEIRDVEKAIQESNLALIEYKNEMREMDWSIFEKAQDYMSEITKESDFIRELLSLNENDLFSKVSGKLTDQGIATGGLHTVDYNVYMAQADEYRKKVEELNKELESDPTNTILIDKKNEYLEAQREAIKNANEEKKAVKDLIEESYRRMLEILQDLIDKRKDALQSEKDLYDYQKSIKEQTKNITDYQKQLTSLAGDDSEEAKAKRQQLQTSLEEAQADLEETEYDQWLSDQEKLLDDLYSQYEEVLNARLDNIDGLMMDMIESTNANSETINQTIQDVTNGQNGVGYQITSEMSSIWKDTGSGLGKVVSDYSTNFTTLTTTTNTILQGIKDLVDKSVNKTVTTTAPSGGGSSSGGSGGSSGGSGGSSGSSGSSSGGSSGSNKGSFFRYKADGYPKHLLNINTSIIDRMKYHNFDTSWSAMQTAYAGMGLGSASSYVGSYNQNVNMLNWMKSNGFKSSGKLTSMVNSVQEEGLFLGRKDDVMLSKDDWKLADNMTAKLIDFAKYEPKLSAVQSATNVNSKIDNDIKMNITLPNVTNYEEFKRAMQSDPQMQKIVQSMTVANASKNPLGKNSLNKFKYK